MTFKVIYIDDEPGLCQVFEDFFASEDVDVATYTNVAKGVAAIEESRPDLVFLDCRLPHTTGNDVALLIDPKIPLAMITGDLEVTASARFLRTFTKPYKDEELRAFIQGFLEAKAAAQSE